MNDLPAQAITDEMRAAIAAAVRCTCTRVRWTYATTHSIHCARVVAPEALKAILTAAAPYLAEMAAVQAGEDLTP